jgi:hypothetical protein
MYIGFSWFAWGALNQWLLHNVGISLCIWAWRWTCGKFNSGSIGKSTLRRTKWMHNKCVEQD